MSGQTEFLLIGMSWRTAPVEVRGRYSIAASELETKLDAIDAVEGVHERFVLSTCNRTEVLVTVSPGQSLEDAVRGILFAGASPEHLYSFRGVQAVMHLFRTAAGLDSMVLGETEILGQIRTAIGVARERGAVREALDPLLRMALGFGKRVRTETSIGEGTLSVARVGVAIAQRVFGTFDDVTALIVGAGETAQLVGKHLVSARLGRLRFANRTLENARSVAAELGAEALELSELRDAISTSNLVVTCLDGAPSFVDLDAIDRKALRRRDRPLLVVDLSVPRAVAHEVVELDSVLYYDLDDVRRVVNENQRERERASEAAASLLVGEVHKFVSLQTYAAFSPAIAKLRQRFGEVADAVLDEVVGDTASPEAMKLATELRRRLLDVSLSQLKESARHARPQESLSQEYRQFLDNL